MVISSIATSSIELTLALFSSDVIIWGVPNCAGGNDGDDKNIYKVSQKNLKNKKVIWGLPACGGNGGDDGEPGGNPHPPSPGDEVHRVAKRQFFHTEQN